MQVRYYSPMSKGKKKPWCRLPLGSRDPQTLFGMQVEGKKQPDMKQKARHTKSSNNARKYFIYFLLSSIL